MLFGRWDSTRVSDAPNLLTREYTELRAEDEENFPDETPADRLVLEGTEAIDAWWSLTIVTIVDPHLVTVNVAHLVHEL